MPAHDAVPQGVDILNPTLSAPSFPLSWSLMSGDKVEVAQSVLPMLSSITCEQAPFAWLEVSSMLDLLATRASTDNYMTACLPTGAPERRYASLICTLRGAASLGVLVSACQRPSFSRQYVHLCLMSASQPHLQRSMHLHLAQIENLPYAEGWSASSVSSLSLRSEPPDTKGFPEPLRDIHLSEAFNASTSGPKAYNSRPSSGGCRLCSC